MTQTDELRRMLDERGVEHYDRLDVTEWVGADYEICHTNAIYSNGVSVLVLRKCTTPEQAVEATLGRDERESYDAGFASGVKATLQQLYGLLHEYPTLDDIEAWADSQWEVGA